MAEAMNNAPAVSGSVSLTISPPQVMADQPQAIVATGLTPRSCYTLMAWMVKQGVTFQSYAHYVANDAGVIDVSTMTSRGGSYEGVEPMGLFWYLEPLAGKDASKSKAGMKFHLYFSRTWHLDIFLLPGHVTGEAAEDGQLPITDYLAHAGSDRYIDHPKVNRYDIRDGRLKATLFVPEGRGPFLGVLDIYAWVPGLYERRAALLAGRGYVTLALAYADYEGVLDVNDIQLEYFLEALDWLHHHPKVAKCGLAIASHCLSGFFAFHIAAMNSKVKAIVTSNCPGYTPMGIVTYQGRPVATWPGGHPQTAEEVNEILATISRTTFPSRDDMTFAMEQIPDDVQLLLMAGDDDEYISSDHTLALTRRLEQAGKTNYRVIINQGQGHACCEPYIPMITGRFQPKSKVIDFGGQKYAHERGAERVWNETVDFLDQCRDRLKLTNPLSQL